VETSKKKSIAYYVSAHGYGHGVRSCHIIRAVNELFPQIAVHIVSALPESFLSNQIGNARNTVRAESFDVGMVQLDSIRVDVDATLDKVERLYARRKTIVKREADFLGKNAIGAVVVDIPALPIESAAYAGIPRLAVGNFGWDWIYSEFLGRDTRWRPIIDVLKQQYAQSDLLLRLPFCEKMEAFPCAEDIPLVASPGRPRRPEIASLTGSDLEKKWVLLSFTSLDWSSEALSNVEQLADYEFFTVLPLEWHQSNIHPISREQAPFSDIIASVDAVVSKPGFGILSDCIVNRKPLIYAERRNFLEYPILESGIRRYLKHIHIPASDLYRGDLKGSLDNIWDRPEPEERLPQGGDSIAAQRIAQLGA
jgi:L-arabinokinase